MRSTRAQRAASARSCVTSTSVVCELGIQLEQQFPDPRAGDGVEIAGGLVREQHRGLRDEGAGQRHALLLAAGELPRVVPGAPAQADAAPASRRGAARVRLARQFQRQHDVLERRQRRDQMEGLEHEADALRSQARAAILVELREVLAREQHAPARRHIEAGQQREQRRLAGAGGTDDGDRFARRRCRRTRRRQWSANLPDC